MRSLRVEELSGPGGLALVEAAPPERGAGLTIDVRAAGVTYPDLLMTRGQYQLRPELPFAPGTEVAGTVREAPPGSRFAAGDRVSAFTSWGGYSEVVAVAEERVMPLPGKLDFVEGAALMVNYQTAYFALRVRGRLGADESLLVHGAGGGTGVAAVQVGVALGARVIAVVSGAEKATLARAAGAAEVLELDATSDWVAAARELTGGGVDAVFDPVGGERFEKSLRALAPGGRALVIGFAGGEIQRIPANRLLLKNVDAIGVAWGMYLERAPQTLRMIGEELEDLVESGLLRPLVAATFPLADGARALEQLEAREAVGKSVLIVNGKEGRDGPA